MRLSAWVLAAAIGLSACAGASAPEATDGMIPLPAATVCLTAAQSGNLHFQNFVLGNGSSIFFNSSSGALCQAGLDGSNPTLLTFERGGNLAADTARLFFTESGQAGALVKIAFDGSNQVRIRQSALKYLIVHEDWLYCIEATTGLPVKIKKDGTGRAALVDHPAFALILSGQSLFIAGADSQNGLVRLDLASDSPEILLQRQVSSLNAAGSWLYFSDPADNGRLHAWSLEKGTDAAISSFGVIKPFVVSEGYLYFIDPERQNRLYRLCVNEDNALQPKQAEKIADDQVERFVVLGPYVYYQRPNSARIYRVATSSLEVIRIT